MPIPRILHLFASFDPGDASARAVQLMNAWGPRARHAIVSGVAGALGARAGIAPGVPHEVAQDPPPLTGRPSVARYEAIASFSRRFDLVLTYGWGAIDGVMARRVFGRAAPPVIHHEDGPDDEEASAPRADRALYRRIALSSAHALAVPSRAMGAVARRTWRQPSRRVVVIEPGVPVGLYARPPEQGAIPGFRRRLGEVVVGAVAPLRPAEDLPTLVRAAGGVSGRVRLVIVGDGPGREDVAGAAADMGMSDALVLPGHLDGAHRFLGLFDLLALSSRGDRAPRVAVEAMAAGLPVASPPVGDLGDLLAEENRPYVTPERDLVQLRDSIQALVVDGDARRRVGEANRAKARATYDEAPMIARYAELYEGALRRRGVLMER